MGELLHGACRSRALRFAGIPAEPFLIGKLGSSVEMCHLNTPRNTTASELGVTRQTLYRHIGPGGELRPDGQKLMAKHAA